jgi:hypothetical protein
VASAPGDRLLRVGLIVTVLGLLLSSVALLPLLFPSVELPGTWWFLSMTTGVGLALVIAGLIRASRARRGDRVP